MFGYQLRVHEGSANVNMVFTRGTWLWGPSQWQVCCCFKD